VAEKKERVGVCACYGNVNVVVTEMTKALESGVKENFWPPIKGLDGIMSLMDEYCTPIPKARMEFDKFLDAYEKRDVGRALEHLKMVNFELHAALYGACERGELQLSGKRRR